MREPLIYVSVTGPFSVKTANGVDATPSSARGRALLAYLALAPFGRADDPTLIDLLWSRERDKLSRKNLNTELFNLRVGFDEALGQGTGADLLKREEKLVTLDLDAIELDVDRPDAQFDTPLQGLHVVTDAFQCWLRDLPGELAQRRPRFARPAVRVSYEGEQGFHSAALIADVAQSAADWCAEQIIATDAGSDFDASDTGAAATYVLETLFAKGEEDAAAMLRLRDTRRATPLWTVTEMVPSDPARLIEDITSHRLINESVDRLMHALAPPGQDTPESRFLQRGVLGASRLIFRNTGVDVASADRQLARITAETGSGLAQAWRGYALAYLETDHGMDPQEARDRAAAYTAKALEADPCNAMTLALASFTQTYTLKSPAAGERLARESLSLNRANPLAHAFLAAALFHQDRTAEGLDAAQRASRIAGSGPYRPIIDNLLCIAATYAQDWELAISAGEAALARAPEFAPTMRYLSGLYCLTHRDEAREAMLKRLETVDPKFSADAIVDGPSHLAAVMRRAMREGRI